MTTVVFMYKHDCLLCYLCHKCPPSWLYLGVTHDECFPPLLGEYVYIHKYKTVLHRDGRFQKAQIARNLSLALELLVR